MSNHVASSTRVKALLAAAYADTLLIGHPRLVVCLDRRRERASASCPVQGLKQTSPSRRW